MLVTKEEGLPRLLSAQQRDKIQRHQMSTTALHVSTATSCNTQPTTSSHIHSVSVRNTDRLLFHLARRCLRPTEAAREYGRLCAAFADQPDDLLHHCMRSFLHAGRLNSLEKPTKPRGCKAKASICPAGLATAASAKAQGRGRQSVRCFGKSCLYNKPVGSGSARIGNLFSSRLVRTPPKMCTPGAAASCSTTVHDFAHHHHIAPR